MLSVIVPMFNAEKYIKKALESLISQTYSNIEIILIDDASTDDTVSICKKYTDERIKLIEISENLGQVNAYIQGIHVANGEYIAFVDSDDWIDERMYEIMLKKMDESGADIVCCGCYHVYDSYQIVEPANISEIGVRTYSHDELILNAEFIHKKDNPITNIIKLYRCNKILRKELILNNLKYCKKEIRVFEDNNIIIPCILDSQKIVYINLPLYYYRRRAFSTMTLFNNDIIVKNREFLKCQATIFREKNIKHLIASDAYVTSIYSLQRILGMQIKYSEKKKYLEEIAKDLKEYNVSLLTAVQCGASKKLRIVIILMKLRLFFLTYLLGNIYRQVKK